MISEGSVPVRFQGEGPTWREYYETLLALDERWRRRRLGGTSFGVYGARPSWEDTVRRANDLFTMSSWAQLSEEQASLVAPAHTFDHGDALLGSIGRRSTAVRAFLSADGATDRDAVLALLKGTRKMDPLALRLSGGELLARLCEVEGIAISFGTRLMTLARPDAFVVVNNKSRDWLRVATGLPLTGKARSYRDLLRWLFGQRWYRSPLPIDPLEARMWRMRAALLDALAYEPYSAEPAPARGGPGRPRGRPRAGSVAD